MIRKKILIILCSIVILSSLVTLMGCSLKKNNDTKSSEKTVQSDIKIEKSESEKEEIDNKTSEEKKNIDINNTNSKVVSNTTTNNNLKKESLSDKYKIKSDVMTYAKVTNMELYKKLYDVVDNIENSIDISAFSVNDKDLENIQIALWNRSNYELFYIKDIKLSSDKKKVNFTYNYSKDVIKNMKAKFNEKVNYILNNVVKPGYTELQKELAIYKYIGENTIYNYDNNSGIDTINAYSIIVNGKGICLGYANALYYLFDKVGMESYTVTSDVPFHMWNIVKIDGQYYHVDATWEGSGTGGRGLKYFNMTDRERNENGDFTELWYGGNKNYKKLELPKCSSEKFKFLRNCTRYSVDSNFIYYLNIDDNKLHKSSLEGKNSIKITDECMGEVVIYNDWIYYTSLNEKNNLYKIKKDGVDKTAVDKSGFVYNLKIINNELSYEIERYPDGPEKKVVKLN